MDKGDQQSGEEPKYPMAKEDAARIQGSYAKQHGGKVDKKCFPAHTPRPLQRSIKTSGKKKEPNSQVKNPRIPWLKKMQLVSRVLMQNNMAAKLIKKGFPARAQSAAA